MKLDPPMRYTHHAKVTGAGAFPIDMLRYDHCWPRSQEDVTQMMLAKAQRTVQVTTYSPYHNEPQWTPGRWLSFGWRLETTM